MFEAVIEALFPSCFWVFACYFIQFHHPLFRPVVFHPSILLWFFFLLCLFFSPKMSFRWPSHPAFTSLYSYTCPSSFFFIYSPHFPSNPHLSSLLLLPFMLFPVNFNLTCFSASISLAFPPCLPVLACCVRQWQRRRLCVKMATKKTR